MSGWRGRPTTAMVVRLTAALALLAGCTGAGDDAAPTTAGPTIAGPATTTTTTTTTVTASPGSEPVQPVPPVLGFDGIELGEGDGSAAAAAGVARLEGTPLDDDAVAAILDRLPPLDADAAAVTEFNWPAETITRPRGEQTDVPFPADGDVERPPATPETLEVLRVQPAGDVGLAPFLSITFNQAMVPVGTIDQLAAAEVPVTISPAVEGRWQWIGTSTLRFDAAGRDRLPMATGYTITVPAGTRSASGAELAEAVEVAFSTPPAEVQGLTGKGRKDLPLQPVLVATFDQDVDAEAVLARVSVTADGDARAMRLATADEITADDAAQTAVAEAVEGRFVAFTPVEPFTTAQEIAVTFAAGIPSAEGPAVSAAEHRFSMRTYAPLRVTRVRCGQPCRPGDGVEITFNNELDAETFDPEALGIEPAVSARTVEQYENVVCGPGRVAAEPHVPADDPRRRRRRVRPDARRARHREIEIGPARPMIRPFEDLVVTVDPSAEPARPRRHRRPRGAARHGVGGRSGRLGWTPCRRCTGCSHQVRARTSSSPTGRCCARRRSRSAATPTCPSRRRSTSPTSCPDGHGQVIVRIASVRQFDENDEDYWSNLPTVAWVQGTDLGVDVVADATSQHVWVTDLATGTPIDGVTVGDTTTGDTVTTDANGPRRARPARSVAQRRVRGDGDA